MEGHWQKKKYNTCLLKVGSVFREGDNLQTFENKMLRKIFVANTDAVCEQLGWFILRNFIIYTGHLLVLG
jgi:hypothetical protein